MIEFKIVDKVPGERRKLGLNMGSIFEAVAALPEGKLLEIPCGDSAVAQRLVNALNYHRKYRVQKRGPNVYVGAKR